MKKKSKKRKKKIDLSKIFLVIVLFTGLALLLYPTVSDWWNSMHQSLAIASYQENVADIQKDRYAEIWKAAEEYNKRLFEEPEGYTLSEERMSEYENLLNVSDTGIMGYIEIPSIDCVLPVYHGTDESVLQEGAGHLEWTSLPTGGPNTHCVISGHRGLPSAKLFTNLDQLKEGDIFTLKILDRTLHYEVDQILTVEPTDTEALQIEEGQDYCTLMTCTPYGVNSHRMLVRGHRVETQ